MADSELIIWLCASLLMASLLSVSAWGWLKRLLPLLQIPYWRLSAAQALLSLLLCWFLALGPEVGWFGLLLFLTLIQPLLCVPLLASWLIVRRIAQCDPLRERI